MAKKGAGSLRCKLYFQRRTESDDGFGNISSGEFETVFAAFAELIPLKGSEPVIASRLSGVQPYLIRIRSCAEARSVTPSWIAVDARSGSEFNITASVDPNNMGAWIEISATSGVPK